MKHKKQDHSIKIQQRDKLSHILNIREFKWTEKQKQFIEIAKDKNTKIVFCNGPAGTSKTLLAVYVSLLALNEKRISDIIYLRAAIESSDAKLGFLPGSADEKIHHYGLPLIDKLDELLPKNQADKLIEDNRVSIFPVGFTRGLNWNAKNIIIDEG